MMEEIKPKKERKFLKAVGNIAKVLANELVMGIARKFIGKAIDKVGNKRQGLVIALVILASTFAIAQFPNTINKQRLGFQTTADGLVWRGSLSDTASIQPVNNQNAWVIIDTVNLKLYSFDFTSNVWNLISGAGGGLTMPFDSITFNTAKNGTVGVGEVEYNDTQGSLIQGLKGGNVTNVIGQQLHQRVNNRTGATLNKGDVVYLAGSQGNRITVAKGLAVSDAFSANTFGVVAEAIADNQSGFIITEGLITGLNTSALTEDSAVYLSPTVAGALTSTKPQAPQHSVYIGVCVKSNNGSGELFVKIRNGQELDELHDTRITNPVTGATLFYSGGLWRDTTAALLVSDTASMLANYATKAYADTTGRFYARQDFSNVSSSTLTWTQSDTLVTGNEEILQVYRNGQILLPSQYTVVSSTSITIAATSYKAGENYTVIFPRGGGAGSGGGSGSLTSISGGTGITVTPNPITTTGVVSADLSVLMELTDTTLLNLTSRFATKQNDIILTTTGVNGAATLSNDTLNIPQYSGGGSVTNIATGYGITGGPITTMGTLVIDSSTIYDFVRDSIVNVQIGRDTIKILKQEYNNVTSDTLTWTTTNKFPIQLRAYILLFRNGQLLINDQYSIVDTNKVKVAATSYKIGENYTLVTVSGTGSNGFSQTGNPIYPEAGIAVSTGTTWASSIANNSSNWNVAFNDKINNAAFSGTTTKTLTLTQYDGGTLTAPFTDLQGIVAADTADMLKNYLRTGVAASTYVSGSGTNNYIPKFTALRDLSNSLIFDSGTRVGINTNTPNINFDIKGLNNTKFNNSTFWNYNFVGQEIFNTSDTLQSISGISFVNGSSRNSLSAIGGWSESSTLGALSFFTGGSGRINQVIEAQRINSNGEATFFYPFTANSSAVFNESSLDADFRVESDGNANMVFVDASTDRVGIGTNAPTKTLDVNGEVRINTTTATPSSLLGKDGSNVVGNVRLTSPLSLAGDSLNLGTVPISKGGTGATSASVARTSLGVDYVFAEVTAGSAVSLTSNRVSIVNTGGLSTTTLDLTPATNGRMYMIKNLAFGTVVSASSNVIPYTGGSPGTAILSAGNSTPQWVTLVADGTNWHMIQKN